MMSKLTAFLLTIPGKVICFLILGLYYRAFLNEFFKYCDEDKEENILKRVFWAALWGFAKILFFCLLTSPILACVIFSLFMSPVETEYKTVTHEVTYSNYDEAYDAGYDTGYDTGYNDAYEEMEREKEEAEEHFLNEVRGY